MTDITRYISVLVHHTREDGDEYALPTMQITKTGKWCVYDEAKTEIESLRAEVSRLGGELKDCTRECDKRKLEGDVMTEQCAKEVKYANDMRDVAKQEWDRAEAMAKALKWALYYGAHRDRRGDFFSRDGMMLTPPKEFREVLRVLFSAAPANEERNES